MPHVMSLGGLWAVLHLCAGHILSGTKKKMVSLQGEEDPPSLPCLLFPLVGVVGRHTLTLPVGA